MDIEFHSLQELIAYYMDYLFCVHHSYPSLLLEIDNENCLFINCVSCKIKHQLNSTDTQSSCAMWKEVEIFFMHLKNSISTISTKLYNNYINLQKNKNFTNNEKLSSLSMLVFLPRYSTFYSLAFIWINGIFKNSIIFHNLIICRLIYATEIFAPFSNYIKISGSLYSMATRGNIEEIQAMQFSDLPKITNTNSLFTVFFSGLPKIYGNFEFIFPFYDFMKNFTEFLSLFRFFLRLPISFEQCLKQNPKLVLKEGQCQICLNSTDDEPLFHPLCDCSFFIYHAHCYT